MVDETNLQIFFDLMNGILGPKSENDILKKNMPLFVKKLNCFMACVVKKTEEEFNTSYLLPLVLRNSKDWKNILDRFIEDFVSDKQINPNDECCETQIEDNYYYSFKIEDYGFIILGRKKPFDKLFRNELKPVINFLGKSLALTLEKEKVQTEKKLLRTIIDNIPIHVFAKDLNKKRILSNKADYEFFGFNSEKDIIGKKDIEFLPKDIEINTVEDDDYIFSNKSIINKEIGFIGKNNTKSWCLQSKIPLLNNNGDITGLVGMSMDITSQKEVEETILKQNKTLKIQEEKYRNIISDMNLGFLELDANNEIQFCNNSFIELSGFSEKELIGKDATELFFSKNTLDFIKKDNYLRYISFETRIKNRNGDVKWWLVSTAPNFNDKGKKTGTLLINLDISNQKELAIELKEAVKQTETAANAKEQFLANMSHEIRTPLNGIIGMIRELKKNVIRDENMFYVDKAYISSRHLLSVVNNILDITKIEAGELNISKDNVNLRDSIKEVHTIVSTQLEIKNIEFIVDIDEKISKALVIDKTHIKQILLNVISNSAKFTEKGYIKTNVKCIEDTEFKQDIIISIKDTGIGMDKDYLKNFFAKFQQEDISTSRKYDGSGLGMYITNQLVSAMKGKISVTSEKGIGTTITIKLQLPKGDETYIEEKNALSIDTIQNLKILLVEDNELNRLVATKSLKSLNPRITEAENGRIAVELLKKNPFDIILMDIQMPEMNGIDATKYIRNELKLDIPILALTANVFKSEIDKFLSIGMDSYVTKPFEENEIISKILKLTKHLNLDPQKSKELKPLPKKLYSLLPLVKMSEGDEGFITKMKSIFISSTNQNIKLFKKYLEEKDLKKTKQLIHQIKPSIINFEISSLYADINYIENPENRTFQEIEKKILNLIAVLGKVIIDLAKV